MKVNGKTMKKKGASNYNGERRKSRKKKKKNLKN